MKLFLIRHGETVDNVAGKYAGTTDSSLTNHGTIQANRLGQYLAKSGSRISHIFSSDLQRAFKTAESIRLAQSRDAEASSLPLLLETKQIPLLREQDFGFYEGKRFYKRPKDKDSKHENKTGKELHLEAHKNEPGFQDVESKESMDNRCNQFLVEYLLPVLKPIPKDDTIVVVAHGIILSHLWRCFLKRFPSRSVSVASGIIAADRDVILEHLGGWSNTGFLELELAEKKEIKPAASERTAIPAESLEVPVGLPKHHGLEIATSVTEPAHVLPVVSNPESASVASNDPTLKKASSITASQPSSLANVTLLIKGINNTEHLQGLQKTRGGIGSLKHDDSQKTIESFFKKRKLG